MKRNIAAPFLTALLCVTLTACGSSGSSAEATTESQQSGENWVLTSCKYQHLDAKGEEDSEGIDEFEYRQEGDQFIYSYISDFQKEEKKYDTDGKLLSCDEDDYGTKQHWDFEYDSDGNLVKAIVDKSNVDFETESPEGNKDIILYEKTEEGNRRTVKYSNTNDDMTQWDVAEEEVLDPAGNQLLINNMLLSEDSKEQELSYEIRSTYDSYGVLASQVYDNGDEHYEMEISSEEDGEYIIYTIKDQQWDEQSVNKYYIEDGKLIPVELRRSDVSGKRIEEKRYDDNGNLIYVFNDVENSDSEFTYLFGGRKDDYIAHFQSKTEKGESAEADCHYDDAGNLIEMDITNYDQTKQIITFVYDEDRLQEKKTENYDANGTMVDGLIFTYTYDEVELPQTMLEELKNPITDFASSRTASDLREEQTEFLWEDIVNYYMYQDQKMSRNLQV